MKVYDTCIFFNEQPLLELKLKTLGKLVDVIVIAEGVESFTGNPHKLMAPEVIDRLYTKADIRHIIVEYPANITGAWDRESYLRNSISRGLLDFSSGDICIYGDVDEQINPHKLDEIKFAVEHHGFTTLCLQWLQQKATLKMLVNGKDYDFYHTRAFSHKAYTDFNESVQAMYEFNSPSLVREAGWHFSSMGGPHAIREKLINFAHTEYSGEEFSNVSKLEEIYKHGTDFLGREGVALVPYDTNNLPEHIWSVEGGIEYFGLE